LSVGVVIGFPWLGPGETAVVSGEFLFEEVAFGLELIDAELEVLIG
jgi:hypothetical protein